MKEVKFKFYGGKKVKRILVLGVVFAMIFAVVPFTAEAVVAPEEVWVGDETKDFNFNTIQEAVDVVADGGTVIVAPGTYTETVIIDTPNITLRSSEGRDVTIVDGDGGQVVIQVVNDLGNVTVQGFTVHGWTVAGIGQGVGSREGTAFHVLDNRVIAPEETSTHGNSIQVTGNNSTVIGNEVTGTHQVSPDWSGSGILVSTANNVVIKDNYVYGGDIGIGVQGGTTYGWDAADCNDNTIENNIVENCQTGILVQGDAFDTVIKGNVVRDNEVGIGAQSLKDAPLPEGTIAFTNIIVDNIIGAQVSTKDGVEIPALEAIRNWWGSSDEPVNDVEGDVDYFPWALNDEFTSFATRLAAEDASAPIELEEDVNYIEIDPEDYEDEDVLTIVKDEMEMDFPAALLPSGEVEMIISKKNAGTAPEGFKFLGSVFSLAMTADGNPVTEFEGKVTLVFTYDPDEVDDPDNLDVYWYDPDAEEWVAQNGTVDKEKNTVTIEVDHWSEFALMEAEGVEAGDDDILPVTGNNIIWFLPIGLFMMLAGALWFRRRVTA